MKFRGLVFGAGMAAVAGCSSPGATPTPFEYKATAVWSSQSTPNVTSMTIDGQPYASGEFYMIDEMYPTYADALASFVPRTITITTTTETLTFQLDIGACEGITIAKLDPMTSETDQFSAEAPLAPSQASVTFGLGCFSCAAKDQSVVSCP